MGSSPVTATTRPPSRPDDLTEIVVRFLERHAPHATRVGVAFSGGPDSTALLLAARPLPQQLLAIHVDHRGDPDSGRRARAAAQIAQALEVPFALLEAEAPPHPGRGPEGAARTVRYAALDQAAATHRLDLILLGHHHDDQLETVVLRWIAGSTLVGLAGMQPLRGHFGRPFLGVERARLAQSLREVGLAAVDDPTNRDLRVPRNRIRRSVLPALADEERELVARVAAGATRLRKRLEPVLAARLDLQAEHGGAGVDLAAFTELPAAFHPFALHLLSARAGRHVAPRQPVQAELDRRLHSSSPRLRIDAGDGWRLERHGRRLCLLAPGREVCPFAYTLEVPGVREIPEIEASVGIRPAPPDVFPTDAAGRYRGITLPAGAAHRVVVRSRRPGDRFRPLGSSRSKPLQELLIDWRVRRDLRNWLPLLEVDGEIAWIGGLAVSESFRPDVGSPWWVIEVLPDIQVTSEVSLGRKAFS